MARLKVNKAAAIRAELEKNPEARPRDLIAALLAKKIKVAPAQVSNIRTGLNSKSKAKGRKIKASNGANGHIDIADLLAAKKLVESLGSIEKATTALAALAKLQ
jgi:hypothetical protein